MPEAAELLGTPASPGVGCGIVVVWNSCGAIADETSIVGSIVAVDGGVGPDLMLQLQRANAVVSRQGGKTSHASTLARELNLPYVCGLGDRFDEIVAGKSMRVDGTSGRIVLMTG